MLWIYNYVPIWLWIYVDTLYVCVREREEGLRFVIFKRYE